MEDRKSGKEAACPACTAIRPIRVSPSLITRPIPDSPLAPRPYFSFRFGRWSGGILPVIGITMFVPGVQPTSWPST